MRKVNLVDDGDDLKVLVHRHAGIGNGLSFNPLASIHNKQCSFTGSESTGYFVREIDVTRSIDQIKLIGFTISSFVQQSNSCHLDRNSTLPFNIHRIEHLFLGSATNGTTSLYQAICEGALTVVDVSDDTEITDMRLIHRRGKGPYILPRPVTTGREIGYPRLNRGRTE